MTTVIVDYGMANLRSVQKGLERVGHGAEITSDPSRVAEADKLILPGVGAFRDAIARLRETGLDAPIRDHVRGGKRFFGICLGLQLLFERSHEDGRHEGLALFPGEVVRFRSGEDVLTRAERVGGEEAIGHGTSRVLGPARAGDVFRDVDELEVRVAGVRGLGVEVIVGVWVAVHSGGSVGNATWLKAAVGAGVVGGTSTSATAGTVAAMNWLPPGTNANRFG